MPRLVRPVGHEDRLAVVDHLDELRTRLIVCAVALVAAFALCYIFNQPLLRLLNSPLPSTANTPANHISGLTGDQVKLSHDLHGASAIVVQIARASDLSAPDRALFAAMAKKLNASANDLPQGDAQECSDHHRGRRAVHHHPDRLLLLRAAVDPANPALSGVRVCDPCAQPHERRAVLPIMIAAPVLFAVGVVFTFLVVMPPAVKFLQGYNSSNFNALVQAKPLYSFELLTMAAIGLAFQMPLGLLGLQRAGIINGTTLTRHWRYATVIIAVIAAAMPGADPVTTALETAPLVVLFLASIVMLRIVDRRDAKRALENLTVVNDDEDAPTVPSLHDDEES